MVRMVSGNGKIRQDQISSFFTDFSTEIGVTTIAHGLGGTPTIFLATFGKVVFTAATTVGATNIVLTVPTDACPVTVMAIL